MPSRLHKIYLVNAKISGSTTSGRITEIDARGGAAITGANGVGKTTMLQVIALFFGYSPGKLVQAGENTLPMLRFILPHPESAIIFEYDRGTDQEEICHVILRRESNSDVGEYRFVRGPMRKEMFTAQDETGVNIYLDDEGTRQVALKLGLGDGFSAKVSAAAYRSVILNTPTLGQDNVDRRKLALRYSFHHRALPHLDRLVAAVIKEHLDFDDFSAVAATIVLSNIEKTRPKEGSDKDNQIQLRQSRGQIEQWLRDRDAIERAIGLEPSVKAIRQMINEVRQMDITLGGFVSDCIQLTSINTKKKDQAKQDVAAAIQKRKDAQDGFDALSKALQDQIDEQGSNLALRKTEYSALWTQSEYLTDNDAKEWAAKTLELEGKRGNASAKAEVIKGINDTVNGVVNDYTNRIQRVEKETEERASVMLEEIETIRERYDAEESNLQDQEKQAIAALKEQQAPQLEHANAMRDQCIGAEALAEANIKNPVIDEELVARLDHARQTHVDNQSQVIDTQAAFSNAQSAFNASDMKWSRAQTLVDGQTVLLRTAESLVESIKSNLNPTEGSFHASLASGTDETWQQTLAKIIDPALLRRTDLHPHFTGEASALAFGWGLNLDAIDRPLWIDREDLKVQLEQASRDAQSARAKLTEAEQQFSLAADERSDAEKALDLHKAQLSVAKQKSNESEIQFKTLDSTVENARRNAKESARRQLLDARENLKKAKDSLKHLSSAFELQLTSTAETFEIQIQQAKERRDQLTQQVRDRVQTFRSEQADIVKQLRSDQEDELQSKGVDGKDLTRKQKELQTLQKEIEQIENHGAIARAWVNWLDEQGPNRLQDAKERMDAAEQALDDTRSALTAADQKHRSHLASIGKEESTANNALSTAEGQIKMLGEVANTLSDFAPMGVSTKTIHDLAGELKARAEVQLGTFKSKKRTLNSKSEDLELALCKGSSSTRDFVEGVMKEVATEANDLERTSHLVRVYDRIRTEVLVNVNTSLRTMLDGIRHHRSTISDFESEVKNFNNKLQTGLSMVSSKFQRFQDFQINVVSDLDQMDFVGKLKSLDDVISDHRARHQATYSIDIPSVQTANALRAFMGAISTGTTQIDLSEHITLSGSINDNGVFKTFHSAKELEKISSNGLTAIALISLLSGLLNVIRADYAIYIPWATDEVGRFDGPNFKHLMQMMAENKIDAITASPDLSTASYAYFAHRYVFCPQGLIAEYRDRNTGVTNSFNTEVAA